MSAIVGILSWCPLIPVKALQLIRKSGTRRFHIRVPDFKSVVVNWLISGYPFISSSNCRQSDMSN